MRDAARKGPAILALIVGLVFLISFVGVSRVGGGWFWDLGNGLGFLALAGLLFQMIPYARAGETVLHQRLGDWVLAVALLHAFWFLVGDGAVRVYLQPGAPAAMWFGLVALVGLAVLTVLARMPDRARVHPRFRTFRNVHRVLGFTVVAGAGLHVVLTGFYLSRWWQTLILGLVALAACFGRRQWARLGRPPVATGPAYLIVGALALGSFVLARNLGG